MEKILLDSKYCLRVLRKRLGFTVIAVITLALGIGASTAIFSVVNVVILNPFPYRDPSRVSLVRQRMPKLGVTDALRSSGPEFVDLAQSGIFDRVAAWEGVSRNLTGGEEPERIAASKVSTEFFSILGVEPVLGRVISAEEQGPAGERVLVIAHELWQRRFGGDREVLGQKVFLDDEPYIIIGVMPPRFRFDGAEAWFPCLFDFGQSPRSARPFAILTRLKPGISTAQTEAELELLARQHEQAYAGGTPEYEGRGLYLQSISDFYFLTVRKALFILLGAVALVLLISCVNVANLLLASSMSRLHEIAVRSAMGASRLRIVRQLVTESAVLAVMGGALGLLLAAWGTDGLVALIPPGTLPAGVEVSIDGKVLLFALGLSLITALIFGLGPAFQIARSQFQESLKSGGERTTVGRGHRRAQKVLVIAEVSLSLIVLVMAGLMVRSFAKLMNVDPGLKTERLLSMRINRSPAKSKDGQLHELFFQQVIDRVNTIPGVEGAAVASHMPFVYTEEWLATVDSQAVPADMQTQNLHTRTVSPDYFRVMGIPLLAGEFFSAADRPDGSPVIIINQTMANRFWPDGDATGKRMKLGRPGSNSPWFTVKGVVADSAQSGLDAQVKPEACFVLAQMATRYRRMNLAVRTSGNPKSLAGAIQSEIRQVDKDQPAYQIQTMEELIGESVGERRFAMLILIVFASLALMLAGLGIYGVMSYLVSQRTHEIGLRLALGAGRRDVLKLVLGQGTSLALIGVVIGLVACVALTRLMTSLLFGVSATDAPTLVLIAVLLTGASVLACYVPARRAMQVDPMTALRCQ